MKGINDLKIKFISNSYYFDIEVASDLHGKEILEKLEERFKDPTCRKCGRDLSYFYLYIIKELKKTGLLNKSYKPICCICFK